jgi:hypothetical protein
VSLYVTVLTYYDVLAYVAEAPDPCPIADSRVIPYNNIVPDDHASAELDVLSNDYAFSHLWLRHAFHFAFRLLGYMKFK